jgi:Forkhead domain
LIGAAAAKAAVNGRLVTPTRNESVDAEQSPTSPEDSSNVPLEGLHLLMDYRADEKPSYSYALITRFAILGSPFKSLSLGEIYTMLEAKFPWFARDDSKWRDSIRYNLSSNNWFVKTKRALHQPGVGNLWMVDEESTGGESISISSKIKKLILGQRIQALNAHAKVEAKAVPSWTPTMRTKMDQEMNRAPASFPFSIE